jgi:pimeloyl-ACP methyl ester carboxylesterase
VPYQADEVIAAWQRIQAPLLWVEGSETLLERWWKGKYSRQEFGQRLAQVPRLQEATLDGAGHMLHHDQPAALAALLRDFLDADG